MRISEAATRQRLRVLGGHHLGIAISMSVAEGGSTRSWQQMASMAAILLSLVNAVVLAIPGESGRETHW